MLSFLPASIARQVKGLPFEQDGIGMSGNRVLLFPEYVLKIGAVCKETVNELAMLRFLERRLPVPGVLGYEEENGVRYLLMSRATGVVSCHASLMTDLHHAAELVAEGLHLLWQTDTAGCPGDMRLSAKLALIEETLARGEIQFTCARADVPESPEFTDPEALWRYLADNRPEETLAMTHGDYCMPNLMVENNRVSALIDLGRAGIADPWVDIALAYRSLKHNCDGTHGVYPGWTKELLFDVLGIVPDWDRLCYYLLLDELF